MATAWTSFYPDVLPHVIGAPLVIVRHEIKRAAQAFFAGSRAWQINATTIAVAANQAEVTLATGDTKLDLVRVEKAWLDGKPLDVVTADEMDARHQSDDWQTHTGSPSTVVQITPGVVRLYPIPTVAATTGLKCRVSVQPSNAATEFPDDLATKFLDSIVVGAKSKLLLYPNKPWTNNDLGVALRLEFESDISKARLIAAQSYGRGRIASNPQWC